MAKIIVKRPTKKAIKIKGASKTRIELKEEKRVRIDIKGLGGLRGDKGDKGDKGDAGAAGSAASVTIGATTTLPAGSSATVTNSGTSSAAVLNFGIPQGATGSRGADGTSATVAVGSTSTLPAGSSATVTNSGTSSAAILNFGIPTGATGAAGQNGQDGEDGEAATVTVGTVTTLDAGQPATVTNVGTTSAAILNFGIPKGAKGDSGSGSGDMSKSQYDADSAVANAGGIASYVAQHAPASSWGNITGTLSNQTDLQNALNEKAEKVTLYSDGNAIYSDAEMTTEMTYAQVKALVDDENNIVVIDNGNYELRYQYENAQGEDNAIWFNANTMLAGKPYLYRIIINSDNEVLNDEMELVQTSDLATVATSGSYNDLSNKPTIPTVNNATLTIQKNGSNVATFTANSSTAATANIDVPTAISDLTNTSGSLVSLCTCATAAATAAKVVTVDSGDSNWTLRKGAIIGVKFTYTNTASNVTINVNSTGAKNIWYSGAKYTGNTSWIAGTANRYSYYMYDGTYWVWISGGVDIDNDNIPQAISWTGATTAAKTASMTSYSAVANHYTVINLIYGNTAASAITLNINGKGAKPVYIDGSASSSTNYSLSAGTYIIWYDGTNYYFNSDGSIPKVKCANAITFTGASTGTYDGSSALTVNIPGSGGWVHVGRTKWVGQTYGYIDFPSTNPYTIKLTGAIEVSGMTASQTFALDTRLTDWSWPTWRNSWFSATSGDKGSYTGTNFMNATLSTSLNYINMSFKAQITRSNSGNFRSALAEIGGYGIHTFFSSSASDNAETTNGIQWSIGDGNGTANVTIDVWMLPSDVA